MMTNRNIPLTGPSVGQYTVHVDEFEAVALPVRTDGASGPAEAGSPFTGSCSYRLPTTFRILLLKSYSYSVAILLLKEIADSDPSLEINLDPNSRTLK